MLLICLWYDVHSPLEPLHDLCRFKVAAFVYWKVPCQGLNNSSTPKYYKYRIPTRAHGILSRELYTFPLFWSMFFLVPLGLKSQPDYKQYHQVLKLSKGFALWTLTKTLQYPAEILNFSMSYCRWTLVKRSSSSTEVGFKLAVHPVEKCWMCIPDAIPNKYGN